MKRKEVRTIQKSKTGYYVTLPIDFVKQLELQPGQVVMFTLNKDGNTIILEIPNI